MSMHLRLFSTKTLGNCVHSTFIGTYFYDIKYSYKTQINRTHLYGFMYLNIFENIYLIHNLDSNRYCHFGSESTLGVMAMKGGLDPHQIYRTKISGSDGFWCHINNTFFCDRSFRIARNSISSKVLLKTKTPPQKISTPQKKKIPKAKPKMILHIMAGQLYKNTGSYFEQILRAIPQNEVTTVRPLTSHLTNHPSKTKSLDELINDVLLRTPTHGRASIGRAARTYLHQLCADTGCSLEDLPGAMDERDGWREREAEREREREREEREREREREREMESGKFVLSARLDDNDNGLLNRSLDIDWWSVPKHIWSCTLV